MRVANEPLRRLLPDVGTTTATHTLPIRPSGLSPHGGEPGLHRTGLSRRPVGVTDRHPARIESVPPPALQVVNGAVAVAAPAFLGVTPRIRGEEQAAGPERISQLAQNPWKLLSRNMKQRRVREHTVEILRWR